MRLLRCFLMMPLVVTPLLVAAGCAGSGAGPGGPGGGGLPVDRTFLSTSVTGAPKPLVAGTRVELQFMADGRLIARAGCNSAGGPARIDDGRLVVHDVEVTGVGCDADRHAQDGWLLSFIQSGPRWQLTGDELVLTGGDTEIRLIDRRAEQPDKSLVGPEWKVDTVIKGGVASSMPGDLRAHLTFAADGRVAGSDGCNSFGATAKLDGDRLVLADLISTMRACDAAGDTPGRIRAVLNQPMTYRIEANRLTLTAADGSGLVLAG